jgi:hypothetical protein
MKTKIPVVVLGTWMGISLMLTAPAYARARFEPAPGKVLLIVGQTLEDTRAYAEASHDHPAGWMFYTSLRNLEGLETPFNQGDGTQDGTALVSGYPETALQVGLYMVDQCEEAAKGSLDNSIDRLGDWIARTKRPVFLRVGYEFDGPHNHYPPEDYIRAYRRLVDRFRKRGIRNVAYVWHSYAGQPTALNTWYPGDAYVDWVGLSYFDQPQRFMQPVVEFARQHGKPLMIGESSPWRIQTRYTNSWTLWFAHYFKFIRDNHIQAISYISTDWDSQSQFRNQHWGDTRLQTNPELLKRWMGETSQEMYLHGSPELFTQLEYAP